MKEIPLTQGQVALVDDEDYDELCRYKWLVTSHGYARTTQGTRKCHVSTYMHRVILGVESGEEADHVNGNRLDNRRKNLRVANSSQNKFNQGKMITNTSGFKGVTWNIGCKKWLAQINYGRKNHYLGVFTDKKKAYAAYCSEARIHHGEFAHI